MSDNLSVYCLKYAESVLPEKLVFDGGDAAKQIPISFAIYLIQTDQKNILVDAGCETMPGFDMKDFRSPVLVLKGVGLSASDITDIVITHSHHDHIEAVKYFDRAVVYISKAALESGRKYIPEGFKVSPFEKELFLTPQVRIIEWCGHVKGSSIVEIKTEDSVHILAGDECYTNKNLENKICTGAFCNKEKAIKFIEKYSDKKYRVHTCHDISLKTERILQNESDTCK